MATSKKDEKPAHKAARERVGQSVPPAKGRQRLPRTLAICAALMVVLIAGYAFYRSSANRSAARRLPPLTDVTGKTESLRAALGQADGMARRTPRSADAVGGLGMLYQANHFYEQADPYYALAMDLAPNAPEWPYYLAVVREVTGTTEIAGSLLRQVLALSPDYLPARVKLGDLLLKQGDGTGAEGEYRRCVEQSPREVFALLGLGRVAVERKQWQEAEEYLQRAIEIDPSHGAAYRLLATVCEAKGDADRAQMLRVKAEMRGRFRAMADPWIERLDNLCYDPLYLMVRAETASQTGDLKNQLALLRRAIEVAPADGRPHQAMTAALRKLNDLKGAMTHARRAVELDPNDEEGLNALGFLLGIEGQLDEATKCFETALRVNPESTSSFHGLGMLLAAKQDDRGAAEKLLQACKLSEYRFDEAIGEYVACLMRLKQHQEATDFLRRILQARPSAARVWNSLVRVRLDLGDAASAIAALRQAVTQAPYNPQLAESLASLLASSPESTPAEAQEAIRWARRAVDMAVPNEVPNSMSTLAAAYARSGDFTQAIAVQEQAIVLAAQRKQQERVAEFSRRLDSFKAGRAVSTTQKAS